MKTLIYDKNPDTYNQISNIIQNLSIDIHVEYVSTLNNFRNQYNQYTYDIVFIDFDNKISIEIVDHIHNMHKQQNIILLNDEFTCFNNMDCIKCRAENKTNILIKPFDPSQIIKIFLNNFNCEIVNINKEIFIIEKFKKEVLKKYPYISFIDKTNKFKINSMTKQSKLEALIEITELLEKSEIKHEIEDEYIQIKDI